MEINDLNALSAAKSSMKEGIWRLI